MFQMAMHVAMEQISRALHRRTTYFCGFLLIGYLLPMMDGQADDFHLIIEIMYVLWILGMILITDETSYKMFYILPNSREMTFKFYLYLSYIWVGILTILGGILFVVLYKGVYQISVIVNTALWVLIAVSYVSSIFVFPAGLMNRDGWHNGVDVLTAIGIPVYIFISHIMNPKLKMSWFGVLVLLYLEWYRHYRKRRLVFGDYEKDKKRIMDKRSRGELIP